MRIDLNKIVFFLQSQNILEDMARRDVCKIKIDNKIKKINKKNRFVFEFFFFLRDFIFKKTE